MDFARDSRLPSRFRILSQLGRGAQGAVYEALDLESNLRVALKTVAVPRPEQIVRFKNEFRAIRDLRHPNLVQLGELAEADGQWFFTMELVDGVDFVAWVRGRADPPRDSSSAPTVVSGPPTEPGSGAARAAPPTEAVDRRPAFDEARLRAGLRSLAGALATIHRAGKVHRDVKPSNVLVTAAGRVVLIDFGVVAELADQDSDGGLVIGTSVYMAPEQARAEPVGPAADWYAVGVLLFEALTGRPPFRGTPRDVLRLKCSVEAPAPSLLVDGVPRDLERLCLALLGREAGARPSDDEILAALGGEAAPTLGPAQGGAGRPAFVGRAAELAALERAFAEARAGRLRAVLIEGASGLGKSELAARFVDGLRAREPKLLVLAGRCHEQERVPYNALDALVDGLARFLAGRRIDKLAPLIPPGVEQLGRLFPVLCAVEPIARASLGDERGAPEVARSEAFAALRELVARVARRRPTVLLIDDLQWADRDSALLLCELLRGPAAPPVLFVATARPEADGAICAAAAALGPELERLRLQGLGRADAETLARTLAAGYGAARPIDVAALVDEAQGHPLFLDELVRHVLGQPTHARARTLNDAIFARVCGFPAAARALLEVVAVAGAPIGQRVAAEAAGLAPSAYNEHVAALRAAHLVRIRGTRREDTIEPYHDRVRETVYDRLDAGARAALHLRLGLVLEADGAGADLLFNHFDKAGERARAARHAEAAAQAAARTLAFDRAAFLYRRAVELGRHGDDERRRLLTALGDALTKAGRPQAAAEAFRTAAATGQVGADELLELRRRAAEQLLMGGHLEPGLEATRALLGELGLPLPEAGLGALARLALSQARLTLRPLRWTARRDAELAPEARALLDVHWSVGAGLSFVDSVRGMLFVFGGALLALDVGDEARIARALCAAAVAEAGLGSRRRAHRLLAACRRAAADDGSDRARFYAELAQLGCTFLLDNDWRASLGLFDEGMRLWRASGRTVGWEWDTSEQFACWSLDNLGRLRDLCERVPARIRAAARAGDRFMEVNFRAFFADVHLTADRADEARRDVEDAIASWLPGRDDFGNQHYLALRSLTHIALYAGDVDAVAAGLEARWRRFFRSLMRHVLLLRQDGLMLTASFALQRAVAARQRGDRGAARAHARAARRATDALGRVPLSMARASTARLRAGLAALAGDDEAAVAHLREALRQADDTGAALYAAAIRRRLGALLGGSEGADLSAAAGAWMAAEGVCNPARMTAALVPGWPHPG